MNTREFGSDDRFKTRPPVHEVTLREGKLEIGQSSFFLTLKQNFRGRFLRITETNGVDFKCLIIPAPGLLDFKCALVKIAEIAKWAVQSGVIDSRPIQLQVERKLYEFSLNLDQNGWYAVIHERASGKSVPVIVPVSGLDGLIQLVGEMVGVDKGLPAARGLNEDEVLKRGELNASDRKFTFLLKKNRRGEYLRITESRGDQHSTLVVPSEALAEFKDWVVKMASDSKFESF